LSGVRGKVEPWVRGWWAGKGGAPGAALSLLTLPLEGFYRLLVALRRAAYDIGLLRSMQAPIPVVSVGNLVVGGTGKTPVTAWLVRRLQEMGARPAVLLRGYGDDEARLHRTWSPGAPVITGSDRAKSASEAAASGATVAVLDDGLQHRRLARDLDIVLIAAEHPFPGRCLPRGPYREDASSLSRADLVAVTRRTAPDAQVEETLRRVSLAAPKQPTAVLRLAPAGWTDLQGLPASAPTGDVIAVTGVAYPGSFERLLAASLPGAVELLAFPDHHAFTVEDVRRIRARAGSRTVVVTEKDAVKLAALPAELPTVRVLVLTVHAERGERAIDDALQRTVFGRARAAEAP
jgi:tetraacyldisaccharide 4'-kinase